MKVHELIEKLKEFPQDLDVSILYDGEVRLDVRHAYESKGGDIVLADTSEVVYSDASRPVDAPSAKDERYWCTPSI